MIAGSKIALVGGSGSGKVTFHCAFADMLSYSDIYLSDLKIMLFVIHRFSAGI